MNPNTVVHSELIKVRSLRSTAGSLIAVLVVTVGLSALVCGLSGESGGAAMGLDPLELSFYGLTFGQVAAVCFGALAVSQDQHNAAMRIWLSAVPRRWLFYGAKVATVGGLALAVGVLTGLVTLILGQALIGGFGFDRLDGHSWRAALGSGIYLGLIALFASGLTALLRSGVAVLGLLIPFLLIVPFVFNDVGSGFVNYLPNHAAQLLVQQDPQGPIGPWAGLGVTALWAGTALLAGWFATNRRDA